MSFEIIHFRDAEKILKKKSMITDVNITLEFIYDELTGTLHRREILRNALDAMGWRGNGDLNILPGRRYMYKGFKKKIAIDGNFSSYEYLHTGLLRLQFGFDKGKIESGILLLPSNRSDKSPYGTTSEMLKEEIKMLEPTISLPVTICLYDLGEPLLPE